MLWSDIWIGIKLHFFDRAGSFIVGMIMGFVLGLFGLKELVTGPASAYLFIPFGLAVSLYTAIILRRQYTSSITALVSMGLTGLLFEILTYSSDTSTYTYFQTALLILSSWIVYVLGWYIAGEYQFNIPLPRATLRKVLIWLGGITVFLSLCITIYSHFN